MSEGQTSRTGTICSGQWVVTAAHCFGNGTAGLEFNLCASALVPERSIAVEAVYAHPEFDAANLTNDIAVLKLSADPAGRREPAGAGQRRASRCGAGR